MNSNLTIILILLVSTSGCVSSKLNQYSQLNSKRIAQMQSTIDSLKNQIELQTDKDNIAEPGKVYVQCPISAQFIASDSLLEEIIYTGTNNNQLGIKEKQIETKPSYLEWVLMKTDSLCDSEYSDCSAWGLHVIPAEYITVLTVTDTNRIKEFSIEKFEYQKLHRNGLRTQIRELSCPNVDYSTLVHRIQEALIARGYNLDNYTKNQLDDSTKLALLKFQNTIGIQTGQIDDETLRALGIK